MKHRKLIIGIISVAIVCIILFIVSVFVFDISEENYDADKHIFKDCDEVVIFMRNLYNTKNILVVSNSDNTCLVEAKISKNETYKYEYNYDTQLLLPVDEENE